MVTIPRLRPPGERAGWLRRRGWLLWMGVVLIMAVVPIAWLFRRAPSLNPGLTTTGGHVIAYAILTVLTAWAASVRLRPVFSVLWGMVLAALYGPLMEVVQLPLPYRAFDVRDMAADWVGAAAGALVVSAAYRMAAARRAPRG